jgi:AraC-like DNA-binding protein
MAPTPPIAATPIAFVKAIVQAYARYGKDPHDVLMKAQIAPDQLQNPNGRITAWQMQQISGTAMQELDDEALGWFSRRLPWGSYGMLARASISAPTLHVALQRWCRHHGLIAPDITLTLTTNGDTATIAITEHAPTLADRADRAVGDSAQVKEEPARRAGDTEQKPQPPGLSCLPETMREFCLVSVLRNVLGVACWLLDSRIALKGADFPFEAPPHQNAYSVLFPAPARFQQAQAAIHFDARYLSLPLRRDEKALQAMLQNALPLTVLQYRRDRLLVQQVRQALASHPAHTHSAEGLSQLLSVSPRTLHRQLKEEGATLQQLKDSVRFERATDLLLRTQRPIKQIAEAAGFMNEKSFIRAFKIWSGHGPGEYRHQAAAL